MSYKAIFLNTTFVVVDGYGYLAMCLWNSLQINGLFSLLWSAYLTIVLHKVGLQKKYFVCCRCYDLFIQLMEGYFVLRGTQTICRRKCQSWKSKTSKASSCTESSIATRITIYDGSREWHDESPIARLLAHMANNPNPVEEKECRNKYIDLIQKEVKQMKH